MSAPFTQSQPGRLRIIGADERLAEPRGIKGVLVGASGIGKTSQLWTLDPAATLFVNLEAGELAVAGWPGDEVRVRDWGLARNLVCWIGGPNPAMRDDQPYGPAHFARVCEAFGSPVQLAKYRTVFVDRSPSRPASACSGARGSRRRCRTAAASRTCAAPTACSGRR